SPVRARGPALRSRQLQSRAGLVDGREDDGPTPHALQIIEDLAATLEVESTAVGCAVVRELERAVGAHMLRGDDRRAEVVLGREYRLVERGELGLEHLDLTVAAGAVAEQSELVGELARQVVAHEGEVVVLLHDVARGGEP